MAGPGQLDEVRAMFGPIYRGMALLPGGANPLEVDQMEVWQVAEALGVGGAEVAVTGALALAERVRRAEAGEAIEVKPDITDPDLIASLRAAVGTVDKGV